MDIKHKNYNQDRFLIEIGLINQLNKIIEKDKEQDKIVFRGKAFTAKIEQTLKEDKYVTYY